MRKQREKQKAAKEKLYAASLKRKADAEQKKQADELKKAEAAKKKHDVELKKASKANRNKVLQACTKIIQKIGPILSDANRAVAHPRLEGMPPALVARVKPFHAKLAELHTEAMRVISDPRAETSASDTPEIVSSMCKAEVTTLQAVLVALDQ